MPEVLSIPLRGDVDELLRTAATFPWVASVVLDDILLAHFDGSRFEDDAPLAWDGHIVTCHPGMARAAHPALNVVGAWAGRTLWLVEEALDDDRLLDDGTTVAAWLHIMEEPAA